MEAWMGVPIALGAAMILAGVGVLWSYSRKQACIVTPEQKAEVREWANERGINAGEAWQRLGVLNSTFTLEEIAPIKRLCKALIVAGTLIIIAIVCIAFLIPNA